VAASVALTAFGIDSGIELVSATIVAVRLRALIAGGKKKSVDASPTTATPVPQHWSEPTPPKRCSAPCSPSAP